MHQVLRAWCAGASVLLMITVRSEAGWYGTYGYRQKITLDAGAVGADLVDFPVLITDANVQAALWSHARSDGGDLVFTLSNGVTRLDHEVEQYDAGAEKLVAWVKVPTVSSTGNTEIYLYYGKPSTNHENPAGVWANGYVGVWHLGETAGTNFDSTASAANTIPNAGFGNQNAVGKIDGADAFDGVDDYAVAGSNLGITDYPFTLSAWAKTTNSAATYRTLVSIGKETTSYAGVQIETHAGKARVYINMGNGDIVAGNVLISDGGWHHVVGVFQSRTNRSIYVDGVYDTASVADRTLANPGTRTTLGSRAISGFGSYWDGGLDEIRVSKVARSPAWIATCHANQQSPATFATASAEESNPAFTELPWYGGRGWFFRQRMTIFYNPTDDDLSGFPLLITDANVDASLWAHAQSDGADILFTAADGRTKLSHELEYFDPVERKLMAWVRLPVLYSTGDTDLVMYYGSDTAENQEDVAGVWANGFVGVWHLSETAGTNLDSTATAAHTTPNAGFDNQDASGKIDGADAFDGVDDYAGANSNLGITNFPFTLSAWAKTTAISAAYRAMIDIAQESKTYRHVTLATYQGKAKIFWQMGNGERSGGNRLIADGAWHHVVGVFNTTNDQSLYVDGVYDTTLTTSETFGNYLTRTSIGRRGTSAPGNYWSGGLDEIRVSIVARSPAWIAACHRNQAFPSTFVSYALEDAKPVLGSMLIVR